MMRTAVTATTKENGWSSLAAIGSFLVKNDPSFDPRNYGQQKLSELVRAQSYLETQEVKAADGSANVHIQVRLKARTRGRHAA
jgi:hypothetical protein